MVRPLGSGEGGPGAVVVAGGEKPPPCFLRLLHLGFVSHPDIVNDFRDSVAVVGVVDGRRKEILPGQAPKTLMGLAPAIHNTWNPYTVNPFPRHRPNSLLRQPPHG